MQLREVADRELRTFRHVSDSDQAIGFLGSDFSPDGRLWATVSSEGVGLYDAAASREVGFLPLGRTCSVQFLPDGRSMITSSTSGIRFWPLTHGKETGELKIGPPTRLAEGGLVMPVSSPARTASRSQRSLMEIKSRFGNEQVPATTAVCRRHESACFIAMSPDGEWIASATWGGEGGVEQFQCRIHR